jgi:hypothetical protein
MSWSRASCKTPIMPFCGRINEMPGLFDGAFDSGGLLASLLGGAKGGIFGQLNPSAVGQDLAGMAGHVATLPQRALQSAGTFQQTGEYDPAPILEAAGLMVGSPFTPRGALGSSMRPYESAPDSLMGFRRYGPNIDFAESKFPHVQYVEITLPSGEKFVDAIKGMNQSHALERARRNWEGSDIKPITP